MKDKRTRLRDNESDRRRRVQEIMGEVIRQRVAGASVDEAALLRKHADLAPELHDELRKLRAIEAAEKEAYRRDSYNGQSHADEAALKEVQDLFATSLPGYRILQRMEYGGQGVIYQAVQISTNRPIAIKVLLDGPLASERQRRRFEREIDLISRLNHPNIVKIHESGVVRDRHYFVMELVDGIPIDDYLLLERPSVQDCVRIFSKVCKAIADAHQHRVIHRDLKPDNILVDLEGEPHVLDFGLAKTLAEDSTEQASISVAGRALGTLPYMSPEQVDGDNHEVDVRSDIYSLGVLLHHLLTDTFPYPVDVRPALVRAHILGSDPLSLRKALDANNEAHRPSTGPFTDDLERIVLKCLAKEKARRYQSAVALVEDLNRYLAGEAVEAKADSALYVLRKTIRRYRVPIGVAAGILLILMTAGVFTVLHFGSERDHAREMARAALLDLNGMRKAIHEMESLAGGSSLQRKLLRDMVTRYENLEPMVTSDESMGAMKDLILEGLGDMARTEGRHAEAVNVYEDFLQHHREWTPDDTSLREYDLATARVTRKLVGATKPNSRSRFDQAITLGRDLVKKYPEDPDARYELCKSRIEYAMFLHGAGHYRQVTAQIEPALSIARRAHDDHPEEERWTRLLASALEWQGESQIKLGEGDRGSESLEESLRLRVLLLETHPYDVKLKHKVLISSVRVATTYRDRGQIEEARRLFDQAVEIGEFLTKADPKIAYWKRDLISAHLRLAKLHIRNGALDQAEENCRAAVGLGENLLRLEQDNVEWLELRAFTLAYRGKVRFERERFEPAYDDFIEALSVRENLSDRDWDNLALKEDIASTYDWLGRCGTKLGRTAEALAYCQKAFYGWKALLDERPEVVSYATGIVVSKINLATWHLNENTPDDDRSATVLLREAEKTLDQLREAGKHKGWEGKLKTWMSTIEKNRRVIEEHENVRITRREGPMTIDGTSAHEP